MNNRTSVALLLGAIAGAMHDSAEAFAPASSLLVAPIATELRRCRCRSTEASLFRRKKKNDALEGVIPSTPRNDEVGEQEQPQNSRRSFLSVTAAAASLLPLRSYASSDKQLNLSNDDLKTIILSDIIDKSFLVSADITRSVYAESATFTDEIDVYTMDKWIKGTKSLFIPSGSRVSLVGDVEVAPGEVSFRFDEDLMFNIPFKPVCSLTGKVVLTRDENTGLITSYREYWDQSVNEVLKTAKFGKKV
eukprot:CAMPEP_0172551352 /NCGR_PEP_ID=MMETSP1067-20121228/38480_1 /TAXON_ID=265564 ORGANISM="Thalassiosira punctigera, Strain Tpunct2005C2" /NCGR_SAMPLE_ID=MMETSP1067 /ASSEMBLY_ACC=CAM_ASM_000444 /LENGTH=247 /DNA_ID=CAMNT_0013339135 /DNA_START=240 /DNA_END=983 /DNA_ORIENTATION=+